MPTSPTRHAQLVELEREITAALVHPPMHRPSVRSNWIVQRIGGTARGVRQDSLTGGRLLIDAPTVPALAALIWSVETGIQARAGA